MIQDGELILRPIVEADVHKLWRLIYPEKFPEWKNWDAPILWFELALPHGRAMSG